jgi:hypothetical protein
MAGQTVCPRCGARDSFIKGYLPDTCVCRVCQSQLDYREIPGCGRDCKAGEPASEESAAEETAPSAPHNCDAWDIGTQGRSKDN